MISGVSGYSSYNYSSSLSSRPKPPDPAQMQEKLFKTLDSNTDGSVSKDELNTALTAAKESDNSLTIDIDELFSQLDANADGNLSSDETAALLPPPPPPPGQPPSSEELFGALDSNGDGSIDTDELSVLASQAGAATSSDALSELFSQLDADGSGGIDTEELSALTPPPPPPEGSRGGFAQAQSGEADAGGNAGNLDSNQLIAMLLKQYTEHTGDYASSVGSSLDLCA